MDFFEAVDQARGLNRELDKWYVGVKKNKSRARKEDSIYERSGKHKTGSITCI